MSFLKIEHIVSFLVLVGFTKCNELAVTGEGYKI